MDVTDAPSVAEAARVAAVATPQLELLVHSAAIMHPSGRGENTVARLEQAAMVEVLSTNVVGPAILTKSLWQLLRSGKTADAPAKVVAVGAGVGSVGTNQAGGWYSYRLSKTALNALMKNLAIEGKRANVAALTLYPQMVDTAFAKPYLKGNPYPQAPHAGGGGGQDDGDHRGLFDQRLGPVHQHLVAGGHPVVRRVAPLLCRIGPLSFLSPWGAAVLPPRAQRHTTGGLCHSAAVDHALSNLSFLTGLGCLGPWCTDPFPARGVGEIAVVQRAWP
ncbi:unnamed protein product [Prorocentrum cordatum]|uniref:Protochlorophyllide reductase n=1 Tax=Prorocentrum cordatum TaxID=2364126 RepID=A0ABN9U3A7_9DINO|nr:unnamed protein product [Polarella glacialis]